jgi:hypothetical protein
VTESCFWEAECKIIFTPSKINNEFNVENVLKMRRRKWQGRVLKSFEGGKSEKGKKGVFGRLVAERSEGKCDKPWQEDE